MQQSKIKFQAGLAVTVVGFQGSEIADGRALILFLSLCLVNRFKIFFEKLVPSECLVCIKRLGKMFCTYHLIFRKTL